MNSQIVEFLLVSLYVCLAYSTKFFEYEIVEEINGRQYYLIPYVDHNTNSRAKRQTFTGLGSSYTGSIFNTKFDSTAFASKQLQGPLTTGSTLGHSLKPIGSGLSVDTLNTKGFGNDLTDKGISNFFQSSRTRGSEASAGGIGKTSALISNTGFGVSHTVPILNNDNHKLDGTAFASKQFHGPWTAGGSLDYLNKPTNFGASVGASNTKGLGTDLTTKARYNFFQSRDGLTTGTVTGEYNRHFGGPGGTGRPDYGVSIGIQRKL